MLLNESKDLGVIFDNKLQFSPHISQLVVRAKQRLFLLLRSFRTRQQGPLLLGYKSYILPLINYCSPVWSPYLIGDIEAIESVQQLFTKVIIGFENLPYCQRLKRVDLPSLKLRRLRSDLILCFKIVHGLIAGKLLNYGLKLTLKPRRGHSKKLYVDHSRVEARRNFFGNRVVGPWNSLTETAVNTHSIISFKRILPKVSFTKYLKLNYDKFRVVG